MNYDKNKENLADSRQKLKEYYFSNNNFSKGEYITYINSKYFYDLKIHKDLLEKSMIQFHFVKDQEV